MSKKKKSTDEVKQAAKEIASVVVATANVEKPKVDVPKAEPVVAKAEISKVTVAKTAPVKNIKIKATASVRGQYNNMRYEIKSGEVYTFPAPLAEWLISLGRAI